MTTLAVLVAYLVTVAYRLELHWRHDARPSLVSAQQ